jgi:hypothetical protein
VVFCTKVFFQNILSTEKQFALNVRLQRYCLKSNAKIIICESAVLINMFYDSQREVNCNLLEGFQNMVSCISESPLMYTIENNSEFLRNELRHLEQRVNCLLAEVATLKSTQNYVKNASFLQNIRDWLVDKFDPSGLTYRILRYIYHFVLGNRKR